MSAFSGRSPQCARDGVPTRLVGALKLGENAATRFQDQLATLDLQWEEIRMGSHAIKLAMAGSIDKHPNEPLRLRHVHRGCSCGRTIVDVR
jgi:hypothetical protein